MESIYLLQCRSKSRLWNSLWFHCYVVFARKCCQHNMPLGAWHGIHWQFYIWQTSFSWSILWLDEHRGTQNEINMADWHQSLAYLAALSGWEWSFYGLLSREVNHLYLWNPSYHRVSCQWFGGNFPGVPYSWDFLLSISPLLCFKFCSDHVRELPVIWG